MDSLRALIFAVVFFALQALLPSAAQAAYCQPSGSPDKYATCSEACAAIPFNANNWNPPAQKCSMVDPTVSGSTRSCRYDAPPFGSCPNGDSTFGNVTWVSTGSPNATVCSAGYVFDSTSMSCVQDTTCPSGQHWDGTLNQCVNDCPAAGTVKSSGLYNFGTDPEASPITTACDGGCTTSYSGGDLSKRAMINGVWNYFAQGEYTYTGSSCTSGTPSVGASTALPPTTCNTTTQWTGQVNGITVCLDKTNTTSESSSIVQNPDGSSTISKTKTNPDGSTSTTTTNTDANGNSTTTIVNNNNAPDSFCQDHPNDPTCNPEGELNASDSLVQEGEAAFGQEGTGLVPDNFNLSNSLDQNGFLTGACIADKVISMGQFGDLTIPFSELCWIFQSLGYVMLIVAGLISARIVGVF